MPHYPAHLIIGVAALAATLAIRGLTLNLLVKRKLKLSLFLLGAYVALHLLLLLRPELAGEALPPRPQDLQSTLRGLERLTLSVAIINLLVLGLINPLREDRTRDGFPAIVQDAIVIGLLLIVATFVFKEQLLTTSAVGAVVVGFALQDTLGNAFAGLAIQSERPFKVGHWIRVGDFEGRVTEITWRATKMRTKSGNFIVLPNNIIAKEAITNYSEPALPTRVEVEVGVSYSSTPDVVKQAIQEAMAHADFVLRTPAPDVLLVGFDASAMTYRARFWIDDYERDERARDQVRVAIHYAFVRRGIEIPYPIQVEYSREWPAPDSAALHRERESTLSRVDMFASLNEEQRRELAAVTVTKIYGNGEAIVRQGDAGDSMFVVTSGKVAVVIAPDRREVATIEPGGYFGEMSLLTGDPRTATVVARGETVLLEITAEQFRKLGEENPRALEQVAMATVARREELDRVRSAGRGTAVADAPATFLARMKKFLRLR
jgi:small-conductance mechanosensitive channel/CRP-like cAMP-binding protein